MVTVSDDRSVTGRLMSATFARARVSISGQEPGHRIMEIDSAAFSVEPHRIGSASLCGSTAAAQAEFAPVRPSARAAARPDKVRSRISALSNSAIAPRI